MKKLLTLAAIFLVANAFAQDGGISPALLDELKTGYEGTAADKAIRNALNGTPIATLAMNADNSGMIDTHFSDIVPTKGRTNQQSSGRCWLFSGLNVLRAEAIAEHDLGDFTFSQNYLFFYDQLEKANLFLQGIIDTKDLPIDDRKVDWLFHNPISDGGTFAGVMDLVDKYGVVPSEAFPESYTANHTQAIRSQLGTLLRQYGLRLRQAYEKDGKKADLQSLKTEQLKTIYRILVLFLGEPPTEFEWTRCDAKGKVVDSRTYTPKSFFDEYVGKPLSDRYVMLMNDPMREYYKVYQIDYDRHVYDGTDWVYLNLPVDEIKEMAIASIKDSTAMYFSCDVGKFMNRDKGVCDIANYDYDSLLGVTFDMDKKERIQTGASGSTHAMTLIAVDLKDGKPVKWMVENSWGAASGYKGNVIMTDEWFNEYMFRLVVDKKYVSSKILNLCSQEPIMLPAWDPMFAEEE